MAYAFLIFTLQLIVAKFHWKPGSHQLVNLIINYECKWLSLQHILYGNEMTKSVKIRKNWCNSDSLSPTANNNSQSWGLEGFYYGPCLWHTYVDLWCYLAQQRQNKKVYIEIVIIELWVIYQWVVSWHIRLPVIMWVHRCLHTEYAWISQQKWCKMVRNRFLSSLILSRTIFWSWVHQICRCQIVNRKFCHYYNSAI